jgi:hypothetical protein
MLQMLELQPSQTIGGPLQQQQHQQVQQHEALQMLGQQLNVASNQAQQLVLQMLELQPSQTVGGPSQQQQHQQVQQHEALQMLGQQLNITPPTSSAHRRRKNHNYRRNKKAHKLQPLSMQQGGLIDVLLGICKGTDGPTTSIDPLGNFDAVSLSIQQGSSIDVLLGICKGTDRPTLENFDAVVCDQTFDVDLVSQHIFFFIGHTHSYSLFLLFFQSQQNNSFNSDKPIGPTARKSVQRRLLYHL